MYPNDKYVLFLGLSFYNLVFFLKRNIGKICFCNLILTKLVVFIWKTLSIIWPQEYWKKKILDDKMYNYQFQNLLKYNYPPPQLALFRMFYDFIFRLYLCDLCCWPKCELNIQLIEIENWISIGFQWWRLLKIKYFLFFRF
jgi:hypothetical protein